MKKPGIKDRIFGYAELEFPRADSHFFLDLFIKSKVIFKTRESTKDTVILIVPYSEVAYIKKICGEKFSKLNVKIGGAVSFFLKYKSRPGIFFGMILALAVTYYFSLLVWNIEIKGNELLSDEYILEAVEEYGLRVGSVRASVDLDKLSQNIMIRDGSIGWLSVNFRGTTAYVEVIEYSAPDIAEDSDMPRNIVAERDGRILTLDVYEGSPAAVIGDTVKKGDLLISGIVDSAVGGYKLKRADGSIIGEVVDSFVAEIPFEITEKVFTGNTESEKTLIFLGKRIKLSKNSGNNYDKCDIIESVKRIELFDIVKLPLEISETTYNEYEEKSFTLTPEAARERAYLELEEELAELAAYGDVTQKKINAYEKESSYIIEAVIYHTEEIASAQPISQSRSAAQ